jgi:SAM-dependent methyltransferase
METCYKVFRSEVIKDLNLESERFGFEPEVTVKIAKMRYRVYEVPVSYNGRSYAEGKKITWKDGFHSLWLLFRHSVLTSEFLKSGVMEETLTKLTALHEFNQYIYESIAQHLGSSILEVGAGNGNITEFLLGAGDVVASDIDSSILKRLSLRFSGISNLKVMKWDISKPFPAKNLSEGFDSVVCLNVLEHIEDNVSVLKNMKNVLKDHSGNLILLVPAHQYLFSEIDRKLGHHRRYDRDEIVNLLDRTGLEITYFTPFNMFGFFGWLLNGKILRKERLSTAQLELYRYLSSVFIQIEKILKQPFGLSHLIVAQRKYPDS